MKIKALKAFTVRDSETGDLSSIAYGAIADVSDTLGQSLIEDGLAEAYDDGSNDENFKKAVDKSITRVTADMLEGVTNIRNVAFNSCTSLESVEIPNSVTSIGINAFKNCSSLTSIEIPNSVTSIGNRAFYSCSSLASVEIPNSVTSIGDSTFESCTSLTSIEIPNSVTSISAEAFRSCSSLASITVLATSPPTLGASVFQGISQSFKIYVPAESVDVYKAASRWSSYADNIEAIST